MTFPGPVSNVSLFFQHFLMVITKGCLIIIMRTIKAGPPSTLVIDRLTITSLVRRARKGAVLLHDFLFPFCPLYLTSAVVTERE